MARKDVQFAGQDTSNELDVSSATVQGMQKKDFLARLMSNVDMFAKRKYGREPSDYELAKDMGISRENLRNWIAVRNWPSTEQLNKMATFLRCEPWELLHPDPIKLRRQLRAIRTLRDSDNTDE